MIGPILVVDDEGGLRRVLSIALTDAGYQVRTAGSVAEALAIFRRSNPPIVLTDIKMPGQDGIDLLRLIKRENPETEVIMMTGHGDMDLAILSLKNEATDFITKPISDEALEVALKRARERIVMRSELRRYTERLEELVAEKTRRLLDAERLAAVGETVAGLAHAIKNIAGGLEGGIFVLEKGRELGDPEYRLQGWDMIKTHVARIKKMSLDLLGYAKPLAANRLWGDPNQPAREVQDLMFERSRATAVELVLDLAPDPPPVRFDSEGLHRGLLNLVTNALEALEGWESRPARPRVILRTRLTPDRNFLYQVEDNGPGMNPETQNRIFGMFFSTKGSAGTGIGLMLTRKIVLEHGGSISVQSREGQGSTFTICLPASEVG